MESLSRPPHRRKHSTTTNIFSSSFSFKSPYDGVLLSNGGERKSLEAHEYSEIFSGSSSIPVLDIPDLDERAGPGDPRDSKLDYYNIFGGFTSDDVFVPYEKLLNRSAKKRKPRMPAESRPHLQESGALNSSIKTKKPSDEASDQSVDEVQKQINISFNKTNQRNGDASDGKTHVAELHAVPGFTHFFDGTPRLDKTKNDKLPSLKREVSRTWSFSAEVGHPKDKGRSSSETSQVGDKSHNVNEVNLKSQFSKVPPPSTCLSNPSGNKDPGFSRASFVSKEDPSEKIFGDCLPPFPSEEFDENSVDAVSAAALKKAIEQAQESIRIAKMIMERKKEGYQDGSKPRPISSLNVSDREAQIDREAYVSKDNNAKGKHEELGHMFNVLAGIDGKFTQTLHSDTISNAANSEVEKIWENVGADKKHGEAFAGKSEKLHNGEHVKLEMLEENVEATDTQREAKEFPGSVANGVSGTVDLEPGKVGNINSLMPSWFKLPSNVGDMVNFKWRHVTSHHRERSGVIAEQVEKAVDTSQTMQRTGKSVDEDELCQATFDHAKGSGNLVERVLETSQMMEGAEKSVDEDELSEATFSHAKGPESTVERVLNTYQRTTDCCKFVDEAVVSIRQEGEVNKQRENENGNESLEQEDMENRYKNASKGKENGEHGEIHDEEIRITRQKEAHLWFGSKEQLKEALLEEITKREPDIPSETREVEKEVGECHEPEIDNRKQDFTDDGDEPKLAEGLVQNKFEEEHINTCEHGSAGAVEIQEEGSFWDAEVTDDALEDSGRHGDNYNKYEIQEAAYVDNIDEAVELSSSDASTIFDEAQTNDAAQSKDTGPIISETQEACNFDLNNKAEEHQETVNFFNENDTMHEVSETVSAADEDKKAEPFFHLQDNETLGPNSLRRSASEEIFVENKLDDAFEGLSSDGKMDTVGVMDADPEENLPEDENLPHTTSDVHDSEHEYAAKIDAQNFPEYLASDIRTTEFDFADVRQVVEQTSESDEGSVSASNSEKIEGLSAHESEEWAENVMDKISDVEELKDELGDERKYVEDLSRDFFSELHREPKEMDKPKKTGRDEEKGLNIENNKDNLAGTSPAEERDTKESEQHFDSNHQQQRIEAIKRGREREKDRIAVERAIREARERAFAEARERAERSAVEKASAEARQRVMAEAKEKVEKASTEAKLRAERAAVERATAEARERALEKAMSQKTSTERVSSSSRSDGLKHSFSSSDLENGMNTESAQRRKARLERHQRIMERAAKALAEKNMRDLLAQKEQAERNRLADSLDADIKRWATGKEGNLRALLSTLQYILGTDNGWQPISLTEIITTAAVKKAYRKATLYVHPDKLQQRGASVQQKYICEKVFDLLKAAWNRFNSDER